MTYAAQHPRRPTELERSVAALLAALAALQRGSGADLATEARAALLAAAERPSDACQAVRPSMVSLLFLVCSSPPVVPVSLICQATNTEAGMILFRFCVR